MLTFRPDKGNSVRTAGLLTSSWASAVELGRDIPTGNYVYSSHRYFIDLPTVGVPNRNKDLA